MREAALLAILVFCGTGGEICVSHAMKQIGEVHVFTPGEILRVVGRALSISWMWLGLGLMTIGFLSLLTMLSLENVSFVVPVTALSYFVGALGGKFLLGEVIASKRWVGVLLVCLGVALVWVG
jgi:drug/metabolite transporter (DMT)-like permease